MTRFAPTNRPLSVAAFLGIALAILTVHPSAQARRAPAQPAPRDPCSAPANDVVRENCRPGNDSTEWDINGNGDPAIQGYATNISVNKGEKVDFKIRTDAKEYRIDVFRMGWYGGKGARKVATINPSAALPQQQPECLHEAATRLWDCGNWAVSASWQVPADAVSGVYIARPVRADPTTNWRADYSLGSGAPKPEALPHAYGALGGGRLRNAIKEPRAAHIFFIVRDDAGKADVLMATSDPTWQAYNIYGIGNTYTGVAAGANSGQATRSYKASYNRPFQNRPNSFNTTDQFFNADYPLIRWLERNGYNVSYWSGVDTERRGDMIKAHKLYISSGHDEYWSAGMRSKVEAARDAGVNLAFFSGNEVFWKTRYEPGTDASKTPYRTLVVYKETHTRIAPNGELQQGQKIDPLKDVWTGTWRDSSPFNPEGPKPENALTGTIFTVNAFRNDPLVVPAKYGRMRFWRNTDVARLKDSEKAVLGKGILGHEWDEDLDNGFRPAGIVHLSETSVDGVMFIQDFGSVYDAGSATHYLTLYRAPSGALVFGAGTVQWAWGLDNFHDNNTGVPAPRANAYSVRVGVDFNGPVKAMQQATVNLFADMGVQPSSLQNDLVPATASTDKKGPISKIISPSSGDVVGGMVTIRGTAVDIGGAVGGVEVSVDDGRTWHPAQGEEAWTYEWAVPADAGQAVILSRAVDDSANLETPTAKVKVRTARSLTP
jgi:N,N-dimethylformamidase beta subunit-like, C-terminal